MRENSGRNTFAVGPEMKLTSFTISTTLTIPASNAPVKKYCKKDWHLRNQRLYQIRPLIAPHLRKKVPSRYPSGVHLSRFIRKSTKFPAYCITYSASSVPSEDLSVYKWCSIQNSLQHILSGTRHIRRAAPSVTCYGPFLSSSGIVPDSVTARPFSNASTNANVVRTGGT